VSSVVASLIGDDTMPKHAAPSRFTWGQIAAIVCVGVAGAGALSNVSRVRAQTAARSNVTYHKDVEPILQRACQECHGSDPRNWAGFGNRSIDDMSFAWITMYNISESEFKTMVDERKKAIVSR